MKSKILKTIVYFIFSAVFISSTAFFINNNLSIRVLYSTFSLVVRNYTWFIILFSQFIYIYRIDGLDLKDILIYTSIVCIIYLLIHALFEKFDYTSLGFNKLKELYIYREELITFDITKYGLFKELKSKIVSFEANIIVFFLNPIVLLYMKDVTQKSSFLSSFIFLVQLIVFIYGNKILYFEFYLLILFLILKFRGNIETN